MGALRIRACGPAISIQDLGRHGYQRFGVSPAGAMDPLSLAAANLLVGNTPDTAAIELGPGMAHFVSEGNVVVALAGPDCLLEVEGHRVPILTSVGVADGQTITARLGAAGVYAYLALSGGVAGVAEMGSRSQHRRSAIGGPALGLGMSIQACGRDGQPLQRLEKPPSLETMPIRIVPGPQDDYFDPIMLERLCGDGYRISSMLDRMGLRLDGPALNHRGDYNIVSDGIVEGAIQVPGNGQPIVLLRDRQTTGGYPKIATIISADLGRFAQLPAGAPVRFVRVSVEEAIEAARQMRKRIVELRNNLAPRQPELTSERLLSLNLIDGVVSAEGPRG
ncbi:biotin-dependent carboxyltransferase family protein [Bosea sp. (in: a-proteobacteria)]|jgi:biotin-dependent carboxylase-like uncharacterized protein|uniref:5-oxoprolinase subunit C family protein n=1 Tax=Bosea sp. (in: a-proteobacteria) TaxID=1871050 RepID=UPI003F6ED09B